MRYSIELWIHIFIHTLIILTYVVIFISDSDSELFRYFHDVKVVPSDLSLDRISDKTTGMQQPANW